jgi:pimeloyl-ACP methyl ester carboxylesterase
MMKSLRLATSGLRVAYQAWGQGNPVKVLCLHGWLDNSNSFNVLAPFLAQKGGLRSWQLIILDMGCRIICLIRMYLRAMWGK